MDELKRLRSNFLKSKGGRLISIESFVLAFIIFFILAVLRDTMSIWVMIIPVVAAFAFPIIVGAIKGFAWFTAVFFSAIWAILGFLIGKAIINGSVIVGLLVGIIIFVVSFRVHKNYAGLMFHKVSSDNADSAPAADESHYAGAEIVKFCPKCGRRITSPDGLCDVCDR